MCCVAVSALTVVRVLLPFLPPTVKVDEPPVFITPAVVNVSEALLPGDIAYLAITMDPDQPVITITILSGNTVGEGLGGFNPSPYPDYVPMFVMRGYNNTAAALSPGVPLNYARGPTKVYA